MLFYTDCLPYLYYMTFNKIKTILAVLTLTWYFSCAQPKHKFNPEAIKLNDSAFRMVSHALPTDSTIYKNAIALLNRAIKIDSNYLIAWWSKFSYQNELKDYKGALSTAKKLLLLNPDNVTIISITGQAYEKAGDSLSAVKYYKNALSRYNKILDTMSAKNDAYKSMVTSKAITLILLNQQKQSHDMMQVIYEKETDSLYKSFYRDIMNYTRKDALFGKHIDASRDANPINK